MRLSPLPFRLSDRTVPTIAMALWICTLATSTPELRASTEKPSLDARTILERAERVRFPDEGFQVDVAITSDQPGRDPDIRKYRVLSRDNDNTLVMTTAPPADKGQILLMKESDLWLYMPSISQPLRIPLSQRLTGQVANGDLARAKFLGDYKARLIGTTSIEGEDYFLLELTADRRRITYKRILYWVHSTSFRPFKAEFYSVSKRLLKTCYYRNFETILGEVRPTKMVIVDALRDGHESVMEYSHMQLRKLPSKVFTKQYLKKLQ